MNNTLVDDPHDINVAMALHNLKEYSGICSKTSGRLWQYYRDDPTSDGTGNILDFPADNNNSISFKFREKITGQTRNNDAKDVEIILPLKYPSNSWRSLEMSLNAFV